MAETFNQFFACPGCDEDNLLPAIPADQEGCESRELSEVSDLYIIPEEAEDITASWSTTPTYVSGTIDNTETDNTKAKHLVGIGEVPEPTFTEATFPKGVTKDVDGTYTLNFTYYNLAGGTQKNQGYDFVRKLQCGWTGFTFYYGDRSDFIYGKAGGIVPSKVKVVLPKGTGASLNNAIIRISWKADVDPDRKINPIAA